MPFNELVNEAYNNLKNAPGSSKIDPKTHAIITKTFPNKKYIGRPFPLQQTKAYIGDFISREESLEEWSIPKKFAFVGVYAGRLIIYEGQKKPQMTFLTPTDKGNYEVFISKDGSMGWYGDGGDDEPSFESGIKVEKIFVTDKKNTKATNSRFGEIFKNLNQLIEMKKAS